MSMWLELILVVVAPVSKWTHQGNRLVHGLQRSLAVWYDALKLQWHDGGASQPIPMAWFALENDSSSLTGSNQRARSRRPSASMADSGEPPSGWPGSRSMIRKSRPSRRGSDWWKVIISGTGHDVSRRIRS